MSILRTWPPCLAATLVVACAAALASGCKPALQAHFDATTTGPGVALPPDITRGLSTDARVVDCATGTQDGASRFAADWVVARRVDLDAAGGEDWVVHGRHGCLASDGAADWWLYADDGAQRRLVLAAGRARAIDVQAERTNGFHDLVLHREHGAARVTYLDTGYVPAGQAPRTALAGDGAALVAERFAPPEGGGAQAIGTVSGVLEIAPLDSRDTDVHVVRLDGRELLRTGGDGVFADFPLPRVLARFRGPAPFDEVLVLQQRMYGNACSGGPLWLLALRSGRMPVLSPAIDHCGGGEPGLDADAEALRITLPGAPATDAQGAVATERWEFRDGTLRRLAGP